MVRNCAFAGFLALLCNAAACGPDVSGLDDDDDDNGDDDDDSDVDAGASGDAGPDSPPAFFGYIYSHSRDQLFSVDPHTLDVELIGDFGWPPGSEDELMTDIAVDKQGAITGISFGAVYAVDPLTAACTYLAPLDRLFNGMSWVPESEVDATDDEILVGTTLDGSVWQIDPVSGASTQIGNFGGGYISSGDIVSVDGFGTVATVNLNSEDAIDQLAYIDFFNDAQATVIGSTAMYDIWGLGFWGGKVYGFLATNEFVEIEVATGDATIIEDGPVNWWGAGVTTIAPIIP